MAAPLNVLCIKDISPPKHRCQHLHKITIISLPKGQETGTIPGRVRLEQEEATAKALKQS